MFARKIATEPLSKQFISISVCDTSFCLLSVLRVIVILIGVMRDMISRKRLASAENRKLFLYNRRWESDLLEVPRHVRLSLRQGEGNHTLPCFPSQTEHFLLFFFFFFLHCLCVHFKAYSLSQCWNRCYWGEKKEKSRHQKADHFVSTALTQKQSWVAHQIFRSSMFVFQFFSFVRGCAIEATVQF